MINIFNFFKKKEPKSSQGTSWEEIKSVLEPYKRLAWFPKVEEKSSRPTSSKFSGVPALSKNESWPCCGCCDKPMQLFLQLNSQDLPETEIIIFGEGLLQIFYCTNMEKDCEGICEAYNPFSISTLIRVVNYNAEAISSPEKSPVKDTFPEREIIGWVPKEDYPNLEELEHLGVTLTEDQSDLFSDMEDFPLPKDKLLGWPNWVQNMEYPDCPECEKPMKLIFQIDSEDNLPYMFGDLGCLHVTQCEEHKDKLTSMWSCS